MDYTHDKTQAGEYAAEAFARLKKEGLPPTPDIYELWYLYFSGQNPEVVRALDILISNKQKITEGLCREIHQQLVSEKRDKEMIRRASDQINSTIQNVAGAVRDVKSATHEYGHKLGGLSGKVADAKDPQELKKILDSVVTDTRGMLEQNQKLEVELGRSSEVMEELQRNLEDVRREALTDGLTGLSNRKAFDNEILRITEAARTSGKTFSLLMVDIDHFKSFNDNYGHQVGDQVLRLVARTLIEGVKGQDVASRYGGEEFAIILPDTPLQAAVSVANALRKAVATKEIINRSSGEKMGRMTISAGVAEYCPGENIQDLIERADAALYTAKHNGRNQVAAAPTPGKIQKRETVR